MERPSQTSEAEQYLAAYYAQLGLPAWEAAKVRGLLAAHDLSALRGHLVATGAGARRRSGGACARALRVRVRVYLVRMPAQLCPPACHAARPPAAVPGHHKGPAADRWGHLRLRSCLGREEFAPEFQRSDIALQVGGLPARDPGPWLGLGKESAPAGPSCLARRPASRAVPSCQEPAAHTRRPAAWGRW